VAEASARTVKAAASYTVDRLITDWAEHHLVSRSASYQKRVPGELRRALKAWLVAPAAMFGRTDAVRVLDAVKVGSGPVAANRLRAEARACWTWAVKRGALDANPWEATPRPLARETARERVLSDAEIGALYRAAGNLTEPFGALIRMMILTGQRRGEVAGMEFGELDLSAQVWRLPGSRTKNHQPHSVPLAPPAVELLRGIKRREGARLVFEGPRRTVPSGFGKIKARLDAALALGESWILHDIRRTVATGLQRLGVRLEVTEALLNHVSGSRSGIVGVYQRHGWEQEKRAALDAWGQFVLRAAEDKGVAGNVVALRAEDSHVTASA
jgi:integrase